MHVANLTSTVVVIAVTAACGNVPSGSGSSSSLQNAGSSSVAECSSAYFAADRACKAGGACVGVFEITPACTVRQVNELRVSDRVVDLVWPRLDGPLYVVTSPASGGHGAWTRVEHPRTATDAELAAATWITETFSTPEPGGFDFGIETDGTRAILTGCAKWSEDEEEWSCIRPVLRTTDKAAVKSMPPPPYTTAWKPGDVVPGIALRKRARDWGDSLECRTSTGAWIDTFHATPIAVAPIADDRWYLFYETAGNRSEPNLGVAAIAMKGCAPDDTLGRIVAPGPDGLSAHSPDEGADKRTWKIHRRGSAAPLTDTAGSPFGLDGAATLVWARS